MSFRVGLNITFDSAVDFVRHVYTKPTRFTRCRRPARSHVEQKRLQTLGDAVLGAAVKQVIYEDYPEFDSGDMTVSFFLHHSSSHLQVIGGNVLSNTNLASLAIELDLDYAYYSATKTFSSTHAIADYFEAHCAVIYQKGGMADLLSFVRAVMGDQIRSCARQFSRHRFSSPAPIDPWQCVYPAEGYQGDPQLATVEEHTESEPESAPEVIDISDDDDYSSDEYSDEGKPVGNGRPLKRQRVAEALASTPAGLTCEAVILSSLDPKGSSVEDATVGPSAEGDSFTNKRKRAACDLSDGYSVD